MDTATQLSPAPSGTQWTIAADGHEAVIVEVGGGLRTYRAGGRDVVDGYAEDQLCPSSAGQVLAPWPNRIRDGRYEFGGRTHQLALSEPARHVASHGLVKWVRWRREEASADSITLAHDLVPQPGYPWPLLLRTTWTVGTDGLTATHEVTNAGREPAPFGLASHPYVMVPDVPPGELRLRIPARVRLLTDSRLLPIGAARVEGTEYDFTAPRLLGATALDTAFGDLIREPDGSSVVPLTSSDGRTVEVWGDRSFGWWQVYTGRGGSVAVEPMTCPADAFRSGKDLLVLEPGVTWRAAWGIRTR